MNKRRAVGGIRGFQFAKQAKVITQGSGELIRHAISQRE